MFPLFLVRVIIRSVRCNNGYLLFLSIYLLKFIVMRICFERGCFVVNIDFREKLFEYVKSSSINLTNEISDTYLNKKLYKYRSGNIRDVDALKNNKLWFGCADNQDDIYDTTFKTKEDWEKLYDAIVAKEPKFKQGKYKEAMYTDGRIFQKDAYLCCFGESADNDDLWNKYANEYKGFCIEYDCSSLISKSLLPVPVHYGDNTISIYEFRDKRAAIIKICFTKQPQWDCQKEWRVMKWGKMLGINYGEKGILVDAPNPKKIILGKCISRDMKELLMDVAKTLSVDVEEKYV